MKWVGMDSQHTMSVISMGYDTGLAETDSATQAGWDTVIYKHTQRAQPGWPDTSRSFNGPQHTKRLTASLTAPTFPLQGDLDLVDRGDNKQMTDAQTQQARKIKATIHEVLSDTRIDEYTSKAEMKRIVDRVYQAIEETSR